MSKTISLNQPLTFNCPKLRMLFLYVTLFLTSRLLKARLQRCFGTFSEMATVTSRPPLAAATRPSIQSVALRSMRSLTSGRHPGRLCRPPATSDRIFLYTVYQRCCIVGCLSTGASSSLENYYFTRVTTSFSTTTGHISRADIDLFASHVNTVGTTERLTDHHYREGGRGGGVARHDLARPIRLNDACLAGGAGGWGDIIGTLGGGGGNAHTTGRTFNNRDEHE